MVIITSNHGEEFGKHGVFDHGYSVFLDEVRVPLVILGSDGSGGRRDGPGEPADPPATMLDLVGPAPDPPSPGWSLAAHWRVPPGMAGPGRPRRSRRRTSAIGLDPRCGPGPSQRGYTISQVASGWHYFRDGTGAEALYDLAGDPAESSQPQLFGDICQCDQ